jgi:inhibitor of nuclear factor kappa-B kinase subunit alpha
LQQNSLDFITKDEWPPNSPDLNPLDYHVWGAMLERYRIHKPKPRNKAELKAVLEVIWADLPQEPIDKAILAFRKRLRACVNADGGHFEHQLR